jgi:hypothetical protein
LPGFEAVDFRRCNDTDAPVLMIDRRISLTIPLLLLVSLEAGCKPTRWYEIAKEPTPQFEYVVVEARDEETKAAADKVLSPYFTLTNREEALRAGNQAKTVMVHTGVGPSLFGFEGFFVLSRFDDYGPKGDGLVSFAFCNTPFRFGTGGPRAEIILRLEREAVRMSSKVGQAR